MDPGERRKCTLPGSSEVVGSVRESERARPPDEPSEREYGPRVHFQDRVHDRGPCHCRYGRGCACADDRDHEHGRGRVCADVNPRHDREDDRAGGDDHDHADAHVHVCLSWFSPPLVDTSNYRTNSNRSQ